MRELPETRVRSETKDYTVQMSTKLVRENLGKTSYFEALIASYDVRTVYVSYFDITFQICILSASGGLFIVLKFIFYFVYKIKKIINQMEDSGESEEKVEEKKPKSVSIGRLGRHLSQKRGDTKSGFSETAKSTNLAWNQLLGFTLFLR